MSPSIAAVVLGVIGVLLTLISHRETAAGTDVALGVLGLAVLGFAVALYP